MDEWLALPGNSERFEWTARGKKEEDNKHAHCFVAKMKAKL